MCFREIIKYHMSEGHHERLVLGTLILTVTPANHLIAHTCTLLVTVSRVRNTLATKDFAPSSNGLGTLCLFLLISLGVRLSPSPLNLN